MFNLNLERLNPGAAERVQPFLEEILNQYYENIHSICIMGTAITDDFDIKSSDINSIFTLGKMDLSFLGLIAPLGKKYSKSKVAAPLIMTPEYIKRSLDVFPVEFLNFKLIYAVVFGDDIFEGIEIDRIDLRHQCERELKTKLIWLRQGYISSMGDTKILAEGFVNTISEYIPLFRGIITLLGQEPPIRQNEVVTALAGATEVNLDAFVKVLKQKREKIKSSMDELNVVFRDLYQAIERLGRIVDEITQ